MEWIRNLKISSKLYLLIAIASAVLIFASLVGFYFTNRAAANTSTLYNDRVMPIVWFSDIKANFKEARTDILELMLTTNPSREKFLASDLKRISKEDNELMEKYEATKLDSYEVDNLAKYKEAVKAYRDVRSKIVDSVTAGKNAQAYKLYVSNINTIMKVETIVKDLAEYNRKVAEELDNTNDKSAQTAALLLLVTTLGALALLATIGIVIVNSITIPVKKAIDGLNLGSDELSSASSQVAAASQQLAEGSSEQAAAVQETSSTLEETSSMVHQNRENTQQAAALAKQTKQYAEKSHLEMNSMSESMTELKASSNEIAKIIKVIDEIAFQTNILSLNAAVEAARAGDAGKGFAVVAEEVRNLAQRSAQAAKDTAVIIESNIELSDNSVNIAKTVKESVESIGEQATKVSDLLDEISVATNEQAQGVEQINKAVSQMEAALHTNASTADESAAASRALQEQAINVRDIVGSLIVLVDGADAVRNQSRTIRTSPSISKTVVKKASVPKSLPKISKSQPSPESIIPLDDF